MHNTVLTDSRNEVRILMLNRPERLNAINAQMLSDFARALDDAMADDDIGAIVIRGSGRAFCSGDDLKEFSSQSASEAETRRFIEDIQGITRRIVLGDKAVLCAVHGWAVGGGLEWAINADLAVFSENTKCFFPEIYWGMFPTGGVTWTLPRMVGLTKARELMLLGEEFTALEALEMGLAWKVVPEDILLETAVHAASKIAAMPRHAVRNLKRAFNDYPAHGNLEHAMGFETEATIEGFLDPETQSRVGNFKN